ncbi:unnamed protein product [Ixodes persulcatus]
MAKTLPMTLNQTSQLPGEKKKKKRPDVRNRVENTYAKCFTQSTITHIRIPASGLKMNPFTAKEKSSSFDNKDTSFSEQQAQGHSFPYFISPTN